MNDIKRLKMFLQKNYPNIQAFNTRNTANDFLLKVYDQDGIIVDYAPNWGYIEIYGLTKEEYKDLLDPNSQFHQLRTFTFKERKKKNENKD